MTRKKFIDVYSNKAVHCDTEEKARDFLRVAHDCGFYWGTGRCLLEHVYFECFEKETCYVLKWDPQSESANYKCMWIAHISSSYVEDQDIVKYEPEDTRTLREPRTRYVIVQLDHAGETARVASKTYAIKKSALEEAERFNHASLVNGWKREAVVKTLAQIYKEGIQYSAN